MSTDNPTDTPTPDVAPGGTPDAAPNAAPNATHSIAEIPTDKASRYLQQLAKHFAHKLPVSFTPETGDIPFSIGNCHMDAEEGRLILTLTAPVATDMPPLQDVVVRHLVRFAFREELTVAWRGA
ncbi:DUF2218 domain-containing protein [Sphingobium sufflavum]|uniref:DUF2218 domain-containing protein n=1 Tax=Sphingobium sufflavum TaxID=1129547 RepID=UPI001F37E7BF|nr:DUF2218 domain-containing protein [Sphingobium sufflavum]MCE7794964.1 DUF2218 domain-containing protein [Sphingobium sufflavum]